MADQITNVPAQGDGGGGMGMGMVVGIIVVILVIIGLFIIFGRGMGTSSPAAPEGGSDAGADLTVPSQLDVNVNYPGGEAPAPAAQ